MNTYLDYVVVDSIKAKVTCEYGWESEEFTREQSDPVSALLKYEAEHAMCLESPREVYYAVAQEIHGNLRILSELLPEPNGRKRAESLAKEVSSKTMTKVLEIRVISTWKG